MNIFIKYFISFLFDFKRKYILNRKIATIYSNLKSKKTLSVETKSLHKKLWSKINSKPNLKWIEVYTSINQIEDPAYISEVDYYNKIEPVLNNRALSEAYCDKNFYHKILDPKILPSIYLRNIQGIYYDEYYKPIRSVDVFKNIFPPKATKIIVKKALDSGGGRGVDLFIKSDHHWLNYKKNILSIAYLESIFIKNFLIQEYIYQHNFFAHFNPSSVNTVRIFTYRSVKDNNVHILHSVFRVGKKGSLVDNQASGGISCGINVNTGELNAFAVDKYGNTYNNSNDILFKAKKVPFFKTMKNIAVYIAPAYVYHRLLGFDFTVDSKDKVKLIEVNNKNNEINFYQMNNGPLFCEYTEEVIEFCKNNSKNIKIDFSI